MTFKEYLEKNKIDTSNSLAVGRAAQVFLKHGSFEESEKQWVNTCMKEAKEALEQYEKTKTLKKINNLLPKIKL